MFFAFWKEIDFHTEQSSKGQTSFFSHICLKLIQFHVLLYFNIGKNYSVTAFDKHSWELHH